MTEARAYPKLTTERPVPPLEPGAEAVSFSMHDGAVLRGYWMPVAFARATILFFLGMGDIAERSVRGFCEWAKELQTNILIYDYRGTGRSDGDGTNEALVADAHEVIGQLTKFSGPGRDHVVLMGTSMGSMAAMTVAARYPKTYDAVVLDSAPTTVTEWADNLVPWYAKPFITIKLDEAMLKLDGEREMRQIHAPVLITVGSADTITPPLFSQKLLAATPSTNKRLQVFEGLDHSGAPNDPTYTKLLDAFLKQVLTNAQQAKRE